MGVVVAGALLLAVFLAIAAAMLWQEARRGALPAPPAYVMEEAVPFVHRRLDEPVRGRLGEADVRRILEWELLYLQGRGEGPDFRAAGSPDGAEYVLRQAQRVQGASYQRSDVEAVLAGEVAYLGAIGAIGDPVRDSTASGAGGRP